MKLPPNFMMCVSALAEVFEARFVLLYAKPDDTASMLTNAPSNEAIVDLLSGIIEEIKADPTKSWRDQ